MATHIHNNFFQSQELVAAYLRHRLPKKILDRLDLSTLKPENTDFLPSRYRNSRRADALWSVKTCQGEEIGLHFEHQSEPTYLMIGRILEYRAAYVKYKLEELKRAEKIPSILSIVVYDGKKEWEGPTRISDLFTNPDLFFQSFSQDFLVDLPNQPLSELKKYGAAALPSLILATQPTGDMCAALQDIAPLLKDCNECCRDAAIEYMISVDKHGEAVFLKELSKFDKPTANKYKTMFERAIQKAVQKAEKKFLSLGIQQGKAEGIQIGKVEGIHFLVSQGYLTKEAANEAIQKLQEAERKG